MAAVAEMGSTPAPARERRRVSAWGVIPTVGVAGVVAAGAAIVAVCAQRPSDLVPPSVRGGMPQWLAGPLHGALDQLSRSHTTNDATFSLLVAAMFGLWVLVVLSARWLPLQIAVAGVVALHAVLWLAPPLPLTDVFNYINYARMGAVHHLNPYTHVPATGFEYAHDPAGLWSNWHHLKSPYGPLFTLATYPLAFVSVPAAFWIFKTAVVAASLGAVALAVWCAGRLGRSQVLAAVVVGLNPVALVWGVGAQHNDSFMVLFILAAVALWVAGHDDWAAALLVGAVALKVSALPLLPLFLIGANDKRAAVRGAGIAALLMGAMSLIAFGPHLPDFATQARMVSALSGPSQVGYALGIGGETAGLRTVMNGLFVAVLVFACWRVWRGASWLGAAGWVMVAALVTTGWLLPWYIAWLAPFSVLAPGRKLLGVLIAISAFMLATSVPSVGSELAFLHYHPTGSAVERANQRYLFAHLR